MLGLILDLSFEIGVLALSARWQVHLKIDELGLPKVPAIHIGKSYPFPLIYCSTGKGAK